MRQRTSSAMPQISPSTTGGSWLLAKNATANSPVSTPRSLVSAASKYRWNAVRSLGVRLVADAMAERGGCRGCASRRGASDRPRRSLPALSERPCVCRRWQRARRVEGPLDSDRSRRLDARCEVAVLQASRASQGCAEQQGRGGEPEGGDDVRRVLGLAASCSSQNLSAPFLPSLPSQSLARLAHATCRRRLPLSRRPPSPRWPCSRRRSRRTPCRTMSAAPARLRPEATSTRRCGFAADVCVSRFLERGLTADRRLAVVCAEPETDHS